MYSDVHLNFIFLYLGALGFSEGDLRFYCERNNGFGDPDPESGSAPISILKAKA